MKIKTKKEVFEEPSGYRFQLDGNELTLVNIWNPKALATFPCGKDKKMIAKSDIMDLRRKLTEHNRKVII